MSKGNTQGDLQRLLGEKEERQVSEQVKKQITALQVEQFVISYRVP
jgi:hypothetical protein